MPNTKGGSRKIDVSAPELVAIVDLLSDPEHLHGLSLLQGWVIETLRHPENRDRLATNLEYLRIRRGYPTLNALAVRAEVTYWQPSRIVQRKNGGYNIIVLLQIAIALGVTVIDLLTRDLREEPGQLLAEQIRSHV